LSIKVDRLIEKADLLLLEQGPAEDKELTDTVEFYKEVIRIRMRISTRPRTWSRLSLLFWKGVNVS